MAEKWTSWTLGQTQRLRELVDTKLPAREIAAILTEEGVREASKGGVIGMCRRLNLTLAAPQGWHLLNQSRVKPKPRPKPTPKAKPEPDETMKTVGSIDALFADLNEPEPDEMVGNLVFDLSDHVAHEPIGTRNVTMLSPAYRSHGGCKFPTGADKEGKPLFCMADAIFETSWCPEHRERVFQPSWPKGRREGQSPVFVLGRKRL